MSRRGGLRVLQRGVGSALDVNVHDASLEGALEPALVRVLPVLVDDLERDVLVRGPRLEHQHRGLAVLGAVGDHLPYSDGNEKNRNV